MTIEAPKELKCKKCGKEYQGYILTKRYYFWNEGDYCQTSKDIKYYDSLNGMSQAAVEMFSRNVGDKYYIDKYSYAVKKYTEEFCLCNSCKTKVLLNKVPKLVDKDKYKGLELEKYLIDLSNSFYDSITKEYKKYMFTLEDEEYYENKRKKELEEYIINEKKERIEKHRQKVIKDKDVIKLKPEYFYITSPLEIDQDELNITNTLDTLDYEILDKFNVVTIGDLLQLSYSSLYDMYYSYLNLDKEDLIITSFLGSKMYSKFNYNENTLEKEIYKDFIDYFFQNKELIIKDRIRLRYIDKLKNFGFKLKD